MRFNRFVGLLTLVATAAFAACGDDDPSGPSGPDAPGTPQNVSATLDLFDLTVSWNAVDGATSYTVTLNDGAADVAEETVSTTSVEFTDLAGGTSYTASVFASNAGGNSAAASASATTPSLNQTFYNVAAFNNLEADPGFDASAFEFGTLSNPPDFTLGAMPAGYTAATVPTTFDANLVAPVDGRTLVDTDYAGAIAPGTAYADAWYNGWTVWAENGSDGRDLSGYAEANIIEVTDDIEGNVTWTSNNLYVLTQPVFVGVDCGTDGSKEGCVEATLTIEPGTTIVGKSDIPQGVRGAYLVVSRGSRLVADATGSDRAPTAAEAIVFTSDKAPGSRAAGDWGGIIINGQAPTNAGSEAQGEGDSGFYGGADDNDDSGILRGVRIEYAGDDVTPTDQLNGLALQGVGAGTTISYLQIHYNVDDGIEPFGGTVSVDHLVVTGIGDDSVDGTDGYRGFMQFVLGQQNGVNADNGFELSNNGDDENAAPHSTAVIANATMIGAGSGVVTGGIAGAESDNGIQFREGTNYRVYNSIFQGFGEAGFCIRDAQTLVNALNTLKGETDPTMTLAAQGLIMWDNQSAGAADNFASCGGGSS
jgi:hypothetical protein